MDTAWLEVFREVARRGSVTAAGRSLGYTQSAVSRHISLLERVSGARLFDRLPRGVRLTEEGRCLLRHAEAVLDRLDVARQELESLRLMDAGRLRVGAFDTADATLVPGAMAGFRAAHPNVTLSLAEGSTPVQLERLRDGDIDVAVVSSYPHQPLDATHLELRRLLDDPLMVALPSGHRLARRRTVRLAELADESWIEGYPETSETLLAACLRAGFRPRIDFAVREWTAKQGFVAAGHGLTLVPLLAAGAVRPDVVLTRLHPDEAPTRTIYAATWRGIAASPSVVTFLHCLAEAARGLRQPRRSSSRAARPEPGDH